MFGHLLLGGAVSFVNFAIHAIVTGIIIVVTLRTAKATGGRHVVVRATALLMVAMTALTIAHLCEIAVWAWFYETAGVFAPGEINIFDAAFENYTALGYGDAVPLKGMRVYGPIAALNGLLLIGWSVAIIFEVLRMAEVQIGRLTR